MRLDCSSPRPALDDDPDRILDGLACLPGINRGLDCVIVKESTSWTRRIICLPKKPGTTISWLASMWWIPATAVAGAGAWARNVTAHVPPLARDYKYPGRLQPVFEKLLQITPSGTIYRAPSIVTPNTTCLAHQPIMTQVPAACRRRKRPPAATAVTSPGQSCPKTGYYPSATSYPFKVPALPTPQLSYC